MISNDLEYRIACTEVLEVLRHMPKKELEKIPSNAIKEIKRYRRYDYKFKYDINKKINEQNISKTAKKMIDSFYNKYINNDRIKELILAKEKFDKKQNA